MATIAQKLSPRALGWDRGSIEVARADLKASERLPLGRIAGTISKLKTMVNQTNGDVQVGLIGNFRGMSSKVGVDEVSSGTCYLPSGIQAMLEGALAEAKATNDKATVSFVMDIYAISAKNAAGYSFEAEPIVEAQLDDPIGRMLADAGKATPFAKLTAPIDPAAAEAAEKAAIAARAEKDKADAEAAKGAAKK